MYYLIECDNLEIFANRGVQLGVVDSFGNETSAFVMSEQTGVYEKNLEYENTNALFALPLDNEKADDVVADEYIKELTAKAEASDDGDDIDVETQAVLDKLKTFVATITPENIEQYFEREDDTELIATPDENGWVEFGSKYIESEDYVREGASGYIKYMMEDGQDFVISGCGYGSEDLSDLKLNTFWRNEDGSITSVDYKAKVDMSFILK